MHELGIAQEVIVIVAERAGNARVTRVVLEIGKLAMIFPDSIRFCFDLCGEGTPVEGATLEIVEIGGRSRCRDCGEETAMNDFFTACRCGSVNLEWLAGSEIKIKEMEVV